MTYIIQTIFFDEQEKLNDFLSGIPEESVVNIIIKTFQEANEDYFYLIYKKVISKEQFYTNMDRSMTMVYNK